MIEIELGDCFITIKLGLDDLWTKMELGDCWIEIVGVVICCEAEVSVVAAGTGSVVWTD